MSQLNGYALCRGALVALFLQALVVPATVNAQIDQTEGAGAQWRRSPSGQFVTGEPDHLQDVVDGTVAGTLSYFQLKPVAAQGDVTYGPGVSFVDMSVDPFDLTFTLEGGTNERLFAELQMGGWGGFMNTWQATVDWESSYASGSGADLQRPEVPCDSSNFTIGEEQCRLALGRGSTCIGFVIDTCQDAFVNTDPAAPDPRLVSPGISAVNQHFMTFGSTPIGGSGTFDSGQVGYGGVLTVDVPFDAAGTYAIDFALGTFSFMAVDGSNIAIAEFRPLVIRIAPSRCCLPSGQCMPGVNQITCDAADGVFGAGEDCSPGACCIDPSSTLDCNDNEVPDECETIVDGDFDGNGILDLDDYAGLVGCRGAPERLPTPFPPACVDACLSAFDFDADGDIDLIDFGLFTERW